MDQGTSPEDMPQPQPERHQGMARRQRRIMIVWAALARAPASGRQGDEDVSVDADTKLKAAVAGIWIVCRIAPGVMNSCCQLCGQIGQELGIIDERQSGWVVERIKQRTRSLRRIARILACRCEAAEQTPAPRRN